MVSGNDVRGQVKGTGKIIIINEAPRSTTAVSLASAECAAKTESNGSVFLINMTYEESDSEKSLLFGKQNESH